jgi:hypothetical protein
MSQCGVSGVTRHAIRRDMESVYQESSAHHTVLVREGRVATR